MADVVSGVWLKFSAALRTGEGAGRRVVADETLRERDVREPAPRRLPRRRVPEVCETVSPVGTTSGSACSGRATLLPLRVCFDGGTLPAPNPFSISRCPNVCRSTTEGLNSVPPRGRDERGGGCSD